MKMLWSNRDYKLYFFGSALSELGDTAMFLALGIWAAELGRSPTAGGLVFFALAAPSLAAPFYGIIVDRFPRRSVLLVAQLISASAVLFLLAIHGPPDLWIIYVVAAVYGAANITSSAGRSALIGQLFESDALSQANAALRTSQDLIRLCSPLLGAQLFILFGGHVIALIDVGTFIVGAAFLSLLHAGRDRGSLAPSRWQRQLADGVRHIWRDTILRPITGASSLAFAALGMSETLVFVVVEKGLGRSPSFLGVMGTFQGLGAVSVGIMAPWLVRRLREPGAIAVGFGLSAAGFIALSTSSLPVVLGGMAALGAGITLGAISFSTVLQRRTPRALQGQVAAATELIVTVPQAISIALGALLVRLVDYRLISFFIAAGFTLGAIALFKSPRLRGAAQVSWRPGHLTKRVRAAYPTPHELKTEFTEVNAAAERQRT